MEMLKLYYKSLLRSTKAIELMREITSLKSAEV
jgi:hypothetical protein